MGTGKTLDLENETLQNKEERARLEKAGAINIFHWCVILLSLLLTLSAWYFSKKQVEEKSEIRFARATAQVKNLILERMEKYENALWAGAGFLRTVNREISFREWADYGKTISIEKKYPGVNGIGVVYVLKPGQVPAFIDEQKKERPYFKVYPQHKNPDCLVVTYIEPLKDNVKAIGLDLAHEENRYTAAKKARDTGKAQITAPIVLVQDEKQTPGFLFFVPFYRGDSNLTVEERQKNIWGIVSAPFVFNKLIKGVLTKNTQYVDIRISDKEEKLYDKYKPRQENYDPNPLFQQSINIHMYGRNWKFDIRSNLSFRNAVSNNQPLTILISGLTIDLLLLTLFILLSKANQQAVNYADSLNRELREKQEKLSQANEELTQFNYRTSHDLVAPLKTIQGYIYLAKDDLKEDDLESAVSYFAMIENQTLSLISLVNSLLNLCRSDHLNGKSEEIDWKEVIENCTKNLSSMLSNHQVKIEYEITQNKIFFTQKVRLQQILENLISNGIKYSDENENDRFVKVKIESNSNEAQIQIEDNGIGIDPKHQARIFEMFFRGDTSKSYGSGLGMYLVQKHIEFLQGKISFDSQKNKTQFVVFIPNTKLEK